MQDSPEDRPSKSARKREALAAQKLGEELILLKDADLDALELPERLSEAIRQARRIRSRAAGARQRQYIGKLMREIDLEPILAALAASGERRPARATRRYVPDATGYNAGMKPLVGIIMGSASDWETMQASAAALDALSIAYEVRVVSAHRTPDLLFEYAASARARGLEVIIAGAGGAAHLPGMTAAKTSVPVLGVPVQSKSLSGLDSLLSIVQMPAGVPVATFAIGVAGATNAALAAAAILANKHAPIRQALDAYRERQTTSVLENSDPRATQRT
jgi:5-(carboxyamino)imidazole ribonucleotide mutase